MSLVERVVVGFDIHRFSSRVARGQVLVQRELDRILDDAADAAGVSRRLWESRAAGDGEVAMLPADVDLLTVVRRLPDELDLRLADHNEHHDERTHIRLRVAMHIGAITPGALGYAGPALVVLQRLLDSAPLRAALEEAPEANLALVISGSLYQRSVLGLGGLEPRRFREVHVDLPAKNFHQIAYLYAPSDLSRLSMHAVAGPKDDHRVERSGFRTTTLHVIEGESTCVDRSFPVTIYLANEAIHGQVQAAVEELVRSVGAEIVDHGDPILGSWFRRMLVRTRDMVNSPLAREAAAITAHTLDTRLVLAHDATVTAKMMENLGPVLMSLQPTKDAVIRVGALLIVKVEWVVSVHQLTAAQQLMLDHKPHLLTAPQHILRALCLSTPNAEVDLSCHLAEPASPPGQIRNALNSDQEDL